MQNSKCRQEAKRLRIEELDRELTSLMLELSEAKRDALPTSQAIARNRTLAALTMAVRESLRAFLTAEEHMS